MSDGLLLSRLWCYTSKVPFGKRECAHYVQIVLAHSSSLVAECSWWKDVRVEGHRRKIISCPLSHWPIGTWVKRTSPRLFFEECEPSAFWVMRQMWEIIQCLITPCVIISEGSMYIFVDAEAEAILEDGSGVSMERFCLCLLSPLYSVMGRWYVNKHIHATVWSPADECDKKTGCVFCQQQNNSGEIFSKSLTWRRKLPFRLPVPVNVKLSRN